MAQGLSGAVFGGGCIGSTAGDITAVLETVLVAVLRANSAINNVESREP